MKGRRKIYPKFGDQANQLFLEFSVNGLGLRKIDLRLFKLKFLIKLDLTRNNVSTIHPGLFNVRLKVLSLSDNALTERSFPPNIKDSLLASSIEKLDLSQNKIRQLPRAITRFRKLRSLIIDNNEVIRLPTNLPRSLKVLSAKDNKLEFTELPRFHRFEKLELGGNPFNMKPSNVITLPPTNRVSSLLQITAQNCLHYNFVYNNKMLPWTVCSMLDAARYCPCHKVII